MNPDRVEEIRKRWAGPPTEMYPTRTEEADYRDVRDLLVEIDQLRALVDQLQARPVRPAWTMPAAGSAITVPIPPLVIRFGKASG